MNRLVVFLKECSCSTCYIDFSKQKNNMHACRKGSLSDGKDICI